MSKGNKKVTPPPVASTIKPAKSSRPEMAAIGEPEGILKKSYIQALIVFALAFGVYINTIPNFYVQDDAAAILENKLVLQGVHGIPKLLTTGFIYGLTGSNEGTYRPVSLVSYAIEYSLWGENPHLSHLVNILLFAISVVLLLYVLRLMFGKKYGLLCFVATLLYAAHPIHTEAVSNIKSRDEIFSFLFALLSLYSFIKLADEYKGNFSGKAALWALAGIGTFFLSMVSKEGSLPFIIIIPLAIYYFRKVDRKTLIVCGCSAAIAIGGYLLLRYELFGSVKNVHVTIQKTDNILAYSDGGRQPLATAFVILVKYIGLLIFPHPLSYDYSFNQIPLYKWIDWQAIFSLVIVIGLLVLAAIRIKKKEISGFAILFFFLTMAVVANIFMVIGSSMAERFMYMPSLGFCILLAVGLVTFLFKPEKNGKISNIGWIVTIVIVSLYSFKTITRNTDWKDNITLYRIDVHHSPNSARTHYSLGTQLNTIAKTETDSVKKKEMLAEAESELLRSLEINPEYPDAMINLGNVYHEEGQFDKELEMLSRVSSDAKGTAQVMFNSGNGLLSKNDFHGAIQKYRAALQLSPEITLPYVNMGIAYSSIGMKDSAIFFLEKAIELDPKMIQAYINLGSAYTAKGDKYIPKAIALYKKALEIDPKSGETYINLGSAEINARQYDMAIQHLNKGAELKPDAPEAYYNIGYANQLEKKYNEAIGFYAKAIKIKSTYSEAYLNTGSCYESMGQYAKAVEYFNKVLDLKVNQIQAYMNLGYCYTKMNRANDAIANYVKVTELSPNEYRAYASLNGIYKKMGDNANAKIYYDKYIAAKKALGQ